MNKLSKEKRDKLILVCIGILAVLGILYTYVLGAQKDQLDIIQTQITGTTAKLYKAEALMKNARMIDDSLAQAQKELNKEQEGMVPQGQYYYWFLKVMDQFRKEMHLDPGFIVDITQPENIEVGLLHSFPYKAYSFGLRLNGQYHDVGRFIAELENTYPYYRVQNVRVAPVPRVPAGTSTEGEKTQVQKVEEKLIVELRVVALMKPGTT